LHQLGERGVALEPRVGDRLEREDHVLGVERLAVLPRDARAQVEDVALPVACDLPALGEVGLGRAVGPQADEPAEDERCDVGIHGVAAGEERIHVLRGARHPFHVMTAARRDGLAPRIGEHDEPEERNRGDAAHEGGEEGPSGVHQRQLRALGGLAETPSRWKRAHPTRR
jgi:hypothetical protein